MWSCRCHVIRVLVVEARPVHHAAAEALHRREPRAAPLVARVPGVGVDPVLKRVDRRHPREDPDDPLEVLAAAARQVVAAVERVEVVDREELHPHRRDLGELERRVNVKLRRERSLNCESSRILSVRVATGVLDGPGSVDVLVVDDVLVVVVVKQWLKLTVQLALHVRNAPAADPAGHDWPPNCVPSHSSPACRTPLPHTGATVDVVVLVVVVVVVKPPHPGAGTLLGSAGSVPQSSSVRSKAPSRSRSMPMRWPAAGGTQLKVIS